MLSAHSAHELLPHSAILMGIARYSCFRISLLMFLLENTGFSAPKALVAAVIRVSTSNASVWSMVRLVPRYLNDGLKEIKLLVPSISNESDSR